MKTRSLLFLLCLCLAGCGPTTLTLRSHGITYEIPFQKQTAPDPGILSDAADKTPHTGMTFIGEFLTIKEFDGSLSINGRNYGTVKAGDKVRITMANEVSVNGSPRTSH
jgi:hypothetical protein